MAGPSTVVGITREAWDELRVHKLRVLLSLIGVAVAVAALTAVVAIADLQQQYLAEQNDRWGGREATIAVSTYSENGDPVDADAWEEHVDHVFERYGFSHQSHNGSVQLPIQLAEGVMDIPARIVDPEFGTIHRVVLKHGRWHVDADAALLSPAV